MTRCVGTAAADRSNRSTIFDEPSLRNYDGLHFKDVLRLQSELAEVAREMAVQLTPTEADSSRAVTW
jgi:hypothetical protein